MENRARNEMEIKLGEVTILLRPTFENIAAMEQNLGSVAWLTWKYSRGTGVATMEKSIKAIPSMTECAQIIFYNQLETKENSQTKKYSLEEIWELVLQEGAKVTITIIKFLGVIASGGSAPKQEEPEAPTESEKKS